MDNREKWGAVVYARNEAFNIAKKMGLKYFLELDDDYDCIKYRYIKRLPSGKEVLTQSRENFDINCLINAYINFMERSNSDCVAIAQGGDLVGGVGNIKRRSPLIRKIMNFFFFRPDSPVKFRGLINEDVNAYAWGNSIGQKLFTTINVMLNQAQTQKQAGGVDGYLSGYGNI